MMPTGLPLLLALSAFVLALLTVLPGIALKAVAFVRRRRESPAILGPLFWHELVTVTRRGSQFRLRMAYAILLLVGLLVTYLNEFRDVNPIRLLFGPGEELPRERITAFAERFFRIFLFCQLLALTLVTPVFAGGSITEEKERGTLGFLQASLLSNREIVLGKLAARVVFVLGLALTGLPVLAITMLFGGVDPTVLLTSFVAAVFSTISLAAYSFWQATRKDSLKAVLLSAYPLVWALLVLGGCGLTCLGGWGQLFSVSPFSLLYASATFGRWGLFDPVEATQIHVAIHGMLAMLFSVLAMGNVRAIAMPREEPKRSGHDERSEARPRWVEITPQTLERPAVSEVQEYRRERPPPRFVRVPPVGDDDPLFWKEIHFGGRLPSFEMDALRGCSLALLVAFLFPVSVGVITSAASAEHPREVVNPVFRIVTFAMLAFVVPLAGVRAVGCVVVERQRLTLDSLFTLPVDRAAILGAKAWAALQWLQYWLIGYGAVVLVSLATGSVHPAALLAATAAIASTVPFFLALAIWLSARCHSVVRATTWFIAVAFAAFLLPTMLAVLVRGAAELVGATDQFFDSFTAALSLPFAVDSLASRSGVEGEVSGVYFGVIAAMLSFGSLSVIFWRSAVRRFESEGK